LSDRRENGHPRSHSHQEKHSRLPE
jgi:hypothetical protein